MEFLSQQKIPFVEKDVTPDEKAAEELAAITGQKPIIRRAKKSIANFKVREGQPIGATVTLRGHRMWEFFDRLVNVARAQYSLGPRSYAGALVTDVEFADENNRVAGADFSWRVTDTQRVNAFLFASRTRRQAGEITTGVGASAVATLTEAGHTIERCDAADRRYPCRGLAGEGTCPLDDYIDVAVLAQEPGVEYLEHGAVCAARGRVPVVEIDPAHAHLRLPASVWTSATGSDLAEVCERAAIDGTAHARAGGTARASRFPHRPHRSADRLRGLERRRRFGRARGSLRCAGGQFKLVGEIAKHLGQDVFQRYEAFDTAILINQHCLLATMFAEQRQQPIGRYAPRNRQDRPHQLRYGG